MPIHGIRAVYQPFSLQERMAPLNMMKEEYDKINESLATLAETANQYYQFLDPDTKKQVDTYNAQLEQVAGGLASDGLKTVNRNTLNGLRRIYASQIKPIQEAAQTVGAIQAQVRDMQMKDPTLIVQSVPTVKDIMADPNARPSLVSGTKLMQDGVNAATQLQGVTYDQLKRYLEGDVTAIPGIEESVDRIARDNNISTDQARSFISRGIMAGLGERAAKMEQEAQKRALDYEYDKRLASYKQGLSNSATQMRLDAEFLASGWKVDPSKKNINERYVFDETKAKQISQSKSRASTKPAATQKEATENYTPRKGTHYVDRTGANVEGLASGKSYGSPQTLSTEQLKQLTDEQLLGIFRTLDIGVDEQDYRNGVTNQLDKDKLVNDYRGYLSLYEFSMNKRSATRSAAKANTNYEIISIDPAGTTKKVTSVQQEADKVAKKVGVESPSASSEEEYDPNLVAE